MDNGILLSWGLCLSRKNVAVRQQPGAGGIPYVIKSYAPVVGSSRTGPLRTRDFWEVQNLKFAGQ